MKDYSRASMVLHEELRGKVEVVLKKDITSQMDLILCYSPGVAEPVKQIANDPERIWDLTIKNNTVAVITDGSAILGLGNLGPGAALPVMEGKCMLFKKFGGINAFPICLDTQDKDEIIETIKRIAPVFGGINLEDISSPRCFEIEQELQTLGIPVFHDDQHGTAIVVLAGLINACKFLNKEIWDLKVVINGAGAAGVAIAKLLKCIEIDSNVCTPVREIIICDTKGIIHKQRNDLTSLKFELLSFTNPNNKKGTLRDAIKDADVFIGVSTEDLLSTDDITTMAKSPIIFAMANPNPEITPEQAYAGGAGVVGTGRSDLPNQVNNVLAFPGIFRGALDCRAKRITPKMKIAAANAIANCISTPSRDYIIPDIMDLSVSEAVAKAVMEAYED
jgi:malate dehydrogenase (oxaloacetate-decarboxylating)